MQDWVMMLLPQIILAGVAVTVLSVRIASEQLSRYSTTIGLVGTAAAFGSLWSVPTGRTLQFATVDSMSLVGSGLIFVSLFIVLGYSSRFLERFELAEAEWTFLLICSALGLTLMFNTTHLLVMFLGLELSSLAFYVLCGYIRDNKKSLESSIKYFILGSIGSAFFLLGVSLIFITQKGVNAAQFTSASTGFTLSFALVLVSLFFKLSLIPLHFWVPDVYEGAPTILTGYMSVAVKIGVIGALIRLSAPVLEISGPALPWVAITWWFAAVTILGGNLLALAQDSLKRMLAYSSIAHAGYVTLGLVSPAPTARAYTAMLFYLSIYVLMNLLAFGIIGLLNKDEDFYVYSDLKGLSQTHPAMALALAVSMISLSGLPPTAGFMGKLMLFKSVVTAGYPALAVVAVLGSLVSVAYYFRVIIYSYMRKPDADEAVFGLNTGPVVNLTAGLSAVIILYLGIHPTWFYEFIHTMGL
ncbi:MAG: NADH-quinone oxidoreductase subunit N [bacterium]